MEKSSFLEMFEAVEWCKAILGGRNTVRFTKSLTDIQKLHHGIKKLCSKLSGWKNSEIKDRLGDVQTGVVTIIEWLTADSEGRNRMLQMAKVHRQGVNFFQSLTSKDVMKDRSVTFVSQLPEGAGYAMTAKGETLINVSSNYIQSRSSDTGAGVIVRGLGHILEKSIIFSSQIKTLPKDSHYKDFFYRNAQGEVYATEVLSVAVGRIYHDPVEFFKEYPNWFGFTMDTLRGVDVSKPNTVELWASPEISESKRAES